MRLVRGLLRVFAFLFNLLLGLFLLGVGVMGYATGEEVRFDLIPGVEGETLIYVLIGSGLYALLAVLLGLGTGRFGGVLMLLWNLLVVSLLIYALARSSYRFRGMEHFETSVIVFLISLLALWGSWAHFRRAGVRRRI